jgi:hypothetical protein
MCFISLPQLFEIELQSNMAIYSFSFVRPKRAMTIFLLTTQIASLGLCPYPRCLRQPHNDDKKQLFRPVFTDSQNFAVV